MTKNGTSKLSALVLLISGALLSCSSLESVKLAVFPPPPHSAERGSPVSTLDGTTVRIMPYDASFDIPEAWLTPNPVETNPMGAREYLNISWDALDQLYKVNGDNHADAEIMDSILPFELSAAHVGSRGWGNYITTDLQARVYIIDTDVDSFRGSVETVGLNRARRVYKTAELKTKQHGDWEGRVMSVYEEGEHTLLFKDVDFYYRRFDKKTVVFVFVHQSGWDETINQMLDSFKWQNRVKS